MEKELLACSIFACVLGGCATATDKAASDQPREEGAYVTGSRLPQRTTGSTPVNPVSKDDWQNQNKGMSGQPGGKTN